MFRRECPVEIADEWLEPGQRAVLPVPHEQAPDLAACLRSGQVFRWRQAGGRWYGPFGERALALRPVTGGIEVELSGAPLLLSEVYRFLALDVEMDRIEGALSGDPALGPYLPRLSGMRILRQDPWDCVVGFVCSQWSNIPKIESTTEQIARRWGRVHRFSHTGVTTEVASLPSPAQLALRSELDLRGCSLGYRSSYVVGTARHVAEGRIQLTGLRDIAYDDALKALMSLPGVGRKVADCILLYSLGHWRAFPVDVWVRRAMRCAFALDLDPEIRQNDEGEGALSQREHRAMVDFAWSRWGPLAGWAQQYLFCGIREGR